MSVDLCFLNTGAGYIACSFLTSTLTQVRIGVSNSITSRRRYWPTRDVSLARSSSLPSSSFKGASKEHAGLTHCLMFTTHHRLTLPNRDSVSFAEPVHEVQEARNTQRRLQTNLIPIAACCIKWLYTRFGISLTPIVIYPGASNIASSWRLSQYPGTCNGAR